VAVFWIPGKKWRIYREKPSAAYKANIRHVLDSAARITVLKRFLWPGTAVSGQLTA